MDLRGFLMRELERGRQAGADPSSLVALLAFALGETLAAAGEQNISGVLPTIADLVRISYRAGVARRDREPPSWRGRLA